MQQQQFIDIVKKPNSINENQLDSLELLVKEYPFFQTAHLLYTKGLHQYDAIKYSKQLRKSAIVVNSRTVLYELIHKLEPIIAIAEPKEVEVKETTIERINDNTNSISITNNDIKVVYVNTISSSEEKTNQANETNDSAIQEIDFIKSIENQTEAPSPEFNIETLNQSIEAEIKKGVIQSYVETEIIKTPELNKEVIAEPNSFLDWLKTVQSENHTYQINTSSEDKTQEKEEKVTEPTKKPSFFAQNKSIIDKIIETDPGRIKLGNAKFFTPVAEAKQSLLENEHLITETLAKIYALQGNISKAIRAYEILSLKFPQKSVYFATLIEKLKTNK